MQYCIWAEMINGGLHADLDNPPNTSMFVRAGNPSVSAQARKSSSVSQVLTEAANVLTSQNHLQLVVILVLSFKLSTVF